MTSNFWWSIIWMSLAVFFGTAAIKIHLWILVMGWSILFIWNLRTFWRESKKRKEQVNA